MECKLAKEVTNSIIDEFDANGFFESKFMDKFKFKTRLYNSLVDMSELEAISKLDSLVIKIYEEVLHLNLKDTLQELVDKGVMHEKNDNGTIKYLVDRNKLIND